MVGGLLLRGMLVGIVAGLLAFSFAKIFGEPQVDSAIAFEEHMAHEEGEAAKSELVSREMQRIIGLLTGVVVYGIGGLFALVFVSAYGRVGGHLRPQTLAALLAFAAFLAVFLVPYLKYPANPPSIGVPETIGYRTGLYFFMVLFSIAALTFAVTFGRRLASRFGGWNGALIAGAAFIVIIAIGQALLLDINEVPADFPAVVLWRFRMASLGIQMVLWGTIGLLFGILAERSLVGGQGRRRASLVHQSWPPGHQAVCQRKLFRKIT